MNEGSAERCLVAIERHEQQIKSLFRKQEELTQLTRSVNELALSVRGLVENMSSMDGRLKQIEEEKRSRAHTVWACLVTGALGALLSYLAAALLH